MPSPRPMDRVSHVKAQKIVEELFYALSGFDTENIYMQHGGDPQLVVNDIPLHLIEPFRSLIILTRQAYGNPDFAPFVSKLLVRLCELRDTVQTIEELYVALVPEMLIFQDLEVLSSGAGPASVASLRSYEVKKHQSRRIRRQMERSVEKWMNAADAAELVEVRAVDEFNGCLWNDMFKMKRGFIKSEDRRAAETSGKIVYLVRRLFGRELVSDEEETEKCALFQPVGSANTPPHIRFEAEVQENEEASVGGAQTHLVSSAAQLSQLFSRATPAAQVGGAEFAAKCGNGDSTADSSVYLEDACEPVPGQLKPFKFGDSFVRRQLELSNILNELIFNDMRDELTVVREILLVQNYTFYLDILHEFGSDFVSGKNEIITKINAFISDRLPPVHAQLFRCVLSNVSLSQYILRLLKTQNAPQTNPYLSVLQRFSIALTPRYLNYFIPEKTLTELKIINRFLFLVNASIYYMERIPRRTFLNVIYLLFMKIKSIEIQTPLYVPDDIDGSVRRLVSEVSRLLTLYSLTCADVFVHWSGLIELCLEYVQLDCREMVDAKRYFDRTRQITRSLGDAIVENGGENEISEFIKTLDWDAYTL